MLSVSSKYAISALLALEAANADGYVSVVELAERSSVPQPYLAKLFKQLAASKVIESQRGPNGGIKLVKEVSFFEICEALGDPIITESCLLNRKECNAKAPCQFHADYKSRREELYEFLKSRSVGRAG